MAHADVLLIAKGWSFLNGFRMGAVEHFAKGLGDGLAVLT